MSKRSRFSHPLTLRTPQGIGDTFWIQQKLFGEKIHWQLPSLKGLALQERAKDFLEIYPSTQSVSFPIVDHWELQTLISGTYRLKDVNIPQPYSLNDSLNHGIRIEKIEPRGVTWNIPLPTKRVSCPRAFDILYLSKGILSEGAVLNPTIGVWTIPKWVEFMQAFWQKFGKKPLILIGADYDQRVLERFSKVCPVHSIQIGLIPEEVLYLISKARWFLGYQSGMGILADNQGTKQIMLYFNYLDKLRYAWCQHPESQFFGYTFNTPITEIINKTN